MQLAQRIPGRLNVVPKFHVRGLSLELGAPPTQPSLGTLIRIGQGFLFSGEWWILLLPAATLLALALSFNLLGDWLRDALNPKLR